MTNIMITNFSTLFSQIPLYIYWKNLDLVFQGGNELFAQAAGLIQVDDIRNKTDFDMPWGSQYAAFYREKDRQVIQHLELYEGEEFQLQASGKKVKVSVRKSPLYNENRKLVGILGCYVEINTFKNQLQEKKISLPRQQAQCLRYLSRGLSSKQIAQRMNLSVRTVDYYINILKEKFSCATRVELLSKLIP